MKKNVNIDENIFEYVKQNCYTVQQSSKILNISDQGVTDWIRNNIKNGKLEMGKDIYQVGRSYLILKKFIDNKLKK